MGGGGEEEGGKVSKVYVKESTFYSSWFNLKHNLKFKIVCATSGQTASQEAIALSRSLVQLLRWQLPSSGLALDSFFSGHMGITKRVAGLNCFYGCTL